MSGEFIITSVLKEKKEAIVCRALRTSDQRRVVLKVLRAHSPSPAQIERLRREYEIGAMLDIDGVVKPLGLTVHDERLALVLEEFGEQSLDHLIGAPMDLACALRIAVQLASTLAEIHRAGVVHRDIKPENILLDTRTGRAKIADFDIAARLSADGRAETTSTLVQGSLGYMAPEQTGKMSGAVDQRADLYSLGVTLYAMLTGRLPFQACDPLEWVHCHVACTPAPPRDVAPSIPEAVSAVVMKLLAKDVEERYPTAAALGADLAACLEQWEARGAITPFPLGAQRPADRLHIPSTLHGREAEIAALRSAYDELVSGGEAPIVLVHGEPGVGKTSLVRTLQRPALEAGALFAEGKFDQYRRNIPYAAIAQAFQDLVLRVAASGEEAVAAWRGRLLEALGDGARILADVIPALTLLIGPQTPVAELPPAGAEHRFYLLFRRLLAVFTAPERPLVLFLDDMQWADAASLALLERALTPPRAPHLLAAFAFRSGAMSASYPFAGMLEVLRASGGNVVEVALAPLTPAQGGVLIAHLLRCDPREAAELAALVHDKTGGNPFFAVRFLLELEESGLLVFDRRTQAFRWDIEAIGHKGYTANVVDLMVRRLRRLAPAAAQEALQIAACLGSPFRAETLASIRGADVAATHRDLLAGIRQGFLQRHGDAYRFAHDRIQQAAYSLIPADELSAVHLKVGALLLAATPRERLEEAVFDIASHYNLGASLLGSRAEKIRVAELNLLAGQRAKAAAAYASASRFLAAGVALLAEDSFRAEHDLAFSLHLELAQCEYLNGRFDEAERLVALALAHSESLAEQALAYKVKVDTATTRGEMERAVRDILDCLRLFGVDAPFAPSDERVRQEYARVAENLDGRAIEELIDLPSMTSPALIALMDVLATGLPAALFVSLNLECLLVCCMVNLSLTHGNTAASATAYVTLGMIAGPALGRYADGPRFGQLGRDYVDRHGLVAYKAKTYIVMYHVMNFAGAHVGDNIAYLRAGQKAAVETGDLATACFCAIHVVSALLTKGERLGDVQLESERQVDFVRQARFDDAADRILSMQRFVDCMRGETEQFGVFDGAGFAEGAFEERIARERIPLMICAYYVLKLQARFLAADCAGALAAARAAEALLWTSPSHIHVGEFHFYEGLTIAACPDEALSDRGARESRLAAIVARYQAWAESCPPNFRDKCALLRAELARVRGDDLEAMRRYEEAIRASREGGFLQNEGVGHELAARFYRDRGFESIAAHYLREARRCYGRWGAEGKVRWLDARYPDLVERQMISPTLTVSVPVEHLDFQSLVKSMQLISAEIERPKLISRLTQIVVEQACAQRGLFLAYQGGWSIEGEAVAAEAPRPPRAAPFPASLLEHVRKTRSKVILDDASAPNPFSADPYLAERPPRSVLCLPVLRKAEVASVVYLESEVLSGLFTKDKLAILELLASQAAISLENAALYSGLQRENAERRLAEEALAESRARLEVVLDTMVDILIVCDRQGRVILTNGACSRLLGLTSPGAADPGELTVEEGLRLIRFRHPDGTPYTFGGSPLSRALAGETLSNMTAIAWSPRAGGDIHLRVSAAPMIDARGAVTGAVAVARDVTELIELDLLKDQFLRVVAHELKTPVAIIKGYAEALSGAAEQAAPRQRRMLEALLRGADRIDKTVTDLLYLAQLQLDDLTLVLERVDLAELVDRAVSRAAQRTSKHRIRITGAAPAVVSADRQLLQLTLTNLLDNAIKYSPGGGDIDVSLELAADDSAVVSVRDRGVGIPRAKQGRIFERLYGAHTDTPHDFGGLGAGLYLCQQIVARHRGRIWFESEEGKGSCFAFSLPQIALGEALTPSALG